MKTIEIIAVVALTIGIMFPIFKMWYRNHLLIKQWTKETQQQQINNIEVIDAQVIKPNK